MHTLEGHYVAALEDKATSDSLGLDAEHCGNELRFINSYLNISFYPNVTMRTVYINTFPHLVVVCTKDIEPGDELLLDYGEGYNQAFIYPKQISVDTPISREELSDVLPFAADSEE